MLLIRVSLLVAGAALASTAFAANPIARYQPEAASAVLLVRHELPADAVDYALAVASQHPQRERFAVSVPLGMDLRDGIWERVDATMSRWRLRLHSPGAVSLAVHLTPLTLPPGSELWTYDARGKTLLGPFTQANVMPLGLWTPAVPGDDLVLEVLSPSAAAKDLRIGIPDAFYAYRAMNAPAPKASSTNSCTTNNGGPGMSGSCNVDAVCQSSAWGNEIRSVADITVGNLFTCSGQLLNDVRQDRRRLFLTARHCGIGHDNGPADSVLFYFNYQNSVCGQANAAAKPMPAATGSTLLADDVQADFSLVDINATATALASANVYYAGWDVTGNTPSSSGADIHHPSNDDKKISLYGSITPSSVNIGTGCDIAAWQVQWSSGVTEDGSSGSGLRDGSSHSVIGVLSGGSAACTACTDGSGNQFGPNLPDYFARLDHAWTANAASNGQLKAWLDPDNTNIARVPGLDGSASGSPITSGPTRAEGPASTCHPGGANGSRGGSPGSLLLGMLGGLALRARRALRNPRSP